MTPQNMPFWCLFFREGSWVNRWRKRSLPSPYLTEVHLCVLSRVCLFVTPWTISLQALLSVGFSRQVYWSGLPFPSLEDLPDTGIECVSPELAGRFFTTAPLGSTVKQGVHFPLRMAPSPFPHYLQEKNDSLLNVGSLYQSEFAYIDFTKVTPVLLLVLSV